MQLYIIRHGQSTNNATSSDPEQRVSDPPLTELGQQQARLVAKHLATGRNAQSMEGVAYSITHLYCSAMQRTLQTTQPIVEALKLTAQVWVDIHERGGVVLHEGDQHINKPGLTRSEIQARFPGYSLPDEITESGWWRQRDGLESHEQCLERGGKVATILRKLATEQPNDRIAMVTHGMFTDSLIRVIFDLPGNERDERYYYGHNNTGITRIDYIEGARPVMRYVNRTDHLPPDVLS